jgi:uncharacterized protein YukE
MKPMPFASCCAGLGGALRGVWWVTRLLALTAVLSSVQAQTTAAAGLVNEASVEKLMRASGMWAQLGAMVPQVQSSMATALDQGENKPSPTERERMMQVVASAYAPERLRSEALRSLVKQLQPVHMPALGAWYDGSSGKAFTGAEERLAADQRPYEQVVQDASNSLQKATPARRELLQNMVLVTQVAQSMAVLTINTALAVAEGSARALASPEAIAGAQALRQQLQDQRQQLEQNFAGLAMALFARTYETFPDAEVQKYLQFLRSPAGQHFSGVSISAMESALVDAAQTMGQALPGTRDGN